MKKLLISFAILFSLSSIVNAGGHRNYDREHDRYDKSRYENSRWHDDKSNKHQRTHKKHKRYAKYNKHDRRYDRLYSKYNKHYRQRKLKNLYANIYYPRYRHNKQGIYFVLDF